MKNDLKTKDLFKPRTYAKSNRYIHVQSKLPISSRANKSKKYTSETKIRRQDDTMVKSQIEDPKLKTDFSKKTGMYIIVYF